MATYLVDPSLYQLRASCTAPVDYSPFTYIAYNDTVAGVYGANIPISSVRITTRLNRPSEMEVTVPRFDSNGRPLKFGDMFEQSLQNGGGSNLAPVSSMLSLYRKGVCVFSGPIVSIQASLGSDTISFSCKDCTWWLEKALIADTVGYSSADIFAMARGIFLTWRTASGAVTPYQYANPAFDIETRTYTTVGGSHTTNANMGKSVSVRFLQHENVMLMDAINQLATLGGDGWQFEWFMEYTTSEYNIATPKMVCITPAVYYETYTPLTGHVLAAGKGSARNVDSVDWVIDGSDTASQVVVAGYGQGTSQQRAVYNDPLPYPANTFPLPTHHKQPLLSLVVNDQTVRRNDQAVERARAVWERSHMPAVTLRMGWRSQEWGGTLPYNVVRPGIRTKPIVRDSFFTIQQDYEMECSSWGLDVSSSGETCTADFFFV